MPTVLALAGAKGSPDHPFDGKDIWPTLAEGQHSPHEDILINVEAFRGAIRKGDWKLVKIALLPGKTELFDLAKDPGEQNNVADQYPEIVSDLEARLARLCQGAEAELVDQGPARLPRRARQDASSIRTSTSTTAGCRTRGFGFRSDLEAPSCYLRCFVSWRVRPTPILAAARLNGPAARHRACRC